MRGVDGNFSESWRPFMSSVCDAHEQEIVHTCCARHAHLLNVIPANKKNIRMLCESSKCYFFVTEGVKRPYHSTRSDA